MASITIRNIDEDVKRRLRLRAAEHERSIEEEARIVLQQALEQPQEPGEEMDLGTAIHALFEPFGEVRLEIPPREPMSEPVDFNQPAQHDGADDCP